MAESLEKQSADETASLMDCSLAVSSDKMLDEVTVGLKSLAEAKGEGMAPSLAQQMVMMMDELSGLSLVKKLDSMTERKMDYESDVCLEKRKVDLTVTMLE